MSAQSTVLEVDSDANVNFSNNTLTFRKYSNNASRASWDLNDGYYWFKTIRSNYASAFTISVPNHTSVVYTVFNRNRNSDTFYVRGDGLVCSIEGFWDYSDANLKKDILKVDGALSKVMKMRGVNYNLIADSVNQPALLQKGESGKTIDPEVFSTMKKEHNERKHMGFIAQEVEAICPDAVRTMHDGLKAINYSALVPVLVEAIKEQQAEIELQNESISALQVQASASVSLLKEIEGLKKQLEKCCGLNSSNSNNLKSYNRTSTEPAGLTATEGIKLFANAPNPFKESTLIKMSVPFSVRSASLAIYDLSGRQLKAVEVNARGSVSVAIEGNELLPGMYLYSLLADGQLVDTKTMVVTE